MKTCSVPSKSCDQYQSDNRKTNDKTKPFIDKKQILLTVMFPMARPILNLNKRTIESYRPLRISKGSLVLSTAAYTSFADTSSGVIKGNRNSQKPLH